MTLGPADGVGPLFGRHVDHVHVVIVALDRPVDHVFAVGQFSVSDHHLAGPHAMRLLRSDAKIVHAAAGKKRRIVPVGPRNRDVAAIILQYGDIGQVLHDAVGFGRGNILVRDGRRIHADVIRDACHPGDVAQLRRIDEHVGLDLPEPAVPPDTQPPYILFALGRLGRRTVPHGEVRLPGDEPLENAVAHRGFEQHVADPPRHQGRIAAVMPGQFRPELVPDAAAQAVIAVGGAHARRGEHAAEPVELLDDQGSRPHAGRLQSGRRSARSPADDHHVVTLGGTACKQPQARQQLQIFQSGKSHIRSLILNRLRPG